ncbi:hypothetical protein LLE49_02210 [Alicyclobacillus tolerans]|uniref:SPOR domain-containing protein n=1 Tax=Alicyclobacillus tolerans TaxID=90970 RepID=UPI001F2F1F70|nr:hypothetical protein [Alicyclobacillus tolerans]MCF8563550.1 hypothetical protein [Alicyclobacillus tolerans]
MEPNRLSSESRQTKHTSHPIIVKVGGQQWIVDESGVAQPLESNQEKVISLKSVQEAMYETTRDHQRRRAKSTSRQPNPSSLRPWAHSVVAHVKNGWKAFHTQLFNSLGRLLEHEGSGPMDNPSAQRPSAEKSTSFARVTNHRRGRKPLRDSFQTGAVVGLILGCLSLVLFHQLEPNLSRQASPTPTNPSISLPASNGLVVPAVHLYALQAGSYPTSTQAQTAVKLLSRHGVKSVIHSGKNYQVFSSIALNPGDLNKLAGNLKKMGFPAAVVPWSWEAATASTANWPHPNSVQDTSRWMFAQVSALNALTGSLMDGEPNRDVSAAYTAAAKIQPSSTQVQDTGDASQINRLHVDAQQAYQQFSQGHHTSSMYYDIQAYEQIWQLTQPGN